MAYLFNTVDDDGDATGKQNIFGGEQTQQGATSQQGGDAIDKTSNAGSSGGGGGGGGTGSVPKQSTSPSSTYNPKGASSAFNQAATTIKMPAKLGEAQGAIAQGNQQLQEKANAYGQKAQETAKGYDLSEDTLKGAAAGQKEAYQATAERLRKAAPDQFESFGGLGDATPNIDYVKDPGRLFASEVGPNYTGGQSRFDAALLRRNPAFRQEQESALAGQKKLQEANQKAITDQTAAANTLLGNAFTQSTGAIKDKLGGYSNDIVSQIQAREKAEDARRAALDPAKVSQADQAKIRQQIQDDLKGADPRSQQARALQYLNDDFDISPYAQIDRDVDWRELVSGDEADQYNRLQGLLGNADMLQAGKGGGDAYTLDAPGAYKALLGQIQGKRAGQDAQSQAEIERIIANAQARAGQVQSEDQGRDARAEALKQLTSYARGKYGDSSGLADEAANYANALFNGTEAQDLSGIIHENSAVDWQSMLAPSDAARLNELNQDIGGLQTYGQGNYQKEIDMRALTDLYEKIFAPHLQRYKDVNLAPPPPPPSKLQDPARESLKTKNYSSAR